MHPSSVDLMRNFIEERLDKSAQLRIADVGSFDVNGCYRPLFKSESWEYVGFDKEPGRNVDHLWPYSEDHVGQFDVVISGQTMEHVDKPWIWIHDVAALAKQGGLIFIIVPNSFHYHGEGHYRDYWRVWPEGLEVIFKEADLEVQYCRRVGMDTFGLAIKVQYD